MESKETNSMITYLSNSSSNQAYSNAAPINFRGAYSSRQQYMDNLSPGYPYNSYDSEQINYGGGYGQSPFVRQNPFQPMVVIQILNGQQAFGEDCNSYDESDGNTINWDACNGVNDGNGTNNTTVTVSSAPCNSDQNYLFLEDLYGGGDKDYDDIIMRTKGLNKEAGGTFRVANDGKVSVDYLSDGGAYAGEVAAFSLKGMENLDRNSDEFKKEAMRRAKSNSREGAVLLSDVSSDGRLDGGNTPEKSFDFNPGEQVGLIYLGNSSFNNVSADGNWPGETYFSTGSKDNVDHFKISKEPATLSGDNNQAKQQVRQSLASAQGVLA